MEVEREGQGAGPCEVEGCALEEVEGDESQGMSALRADKQIVGNAAMAHNFTHSLTRNRKLLNPSQSSAGCSEIENFPPRPNRRAKQRNAMQEHPNAIDTQSAT